MFFFYLFVFFLPKVKINTRIQVNERKFNIYGLVLYIYIYIYIFPAHKNVGGGNKISSLRKFFSSLKNYGTISWFLLLINHVFRLLQYFLKNVSVIFFLYKRYIKITCKNRLKYFWAFMIFDAFFGLNLSCLQD